MARQAIAVVCLVVSFLALAFVETARGVEFSVQPRQPSESVDTSVNFLCTLGKDVSKYKEVFVLDIVKDSDTQVAIIRPGGAVTFKHDNIRKRFRDAKGFMPAVGGDLSKAYLNLTLLLPRVEDSGLYSCLTSYLNVDGLLKQDKVDLSLTVKKLDGSEPHLPYAVNALDRRVQKLEEAVKELKTSCCTKSKRRR